MISQITVWTAFGTSPRWRLYVQVDVAPDFQLSEYRLGKVDLERTRILKVARDKLVPEDIARAPTSYLRTLAKWPAYLGANEYR
jgi:hypothetical protein